MKASINGCVTKIDRAREHIYRINDEIVADKIKLDSRAIRAKQHFKAAAGSIVSHDIIFHIAGSPPEVPLIFSVLAGEAIYHLRSALDHLVYQLVVAHTKQPPTFRSAFPIVCRDSVKIDKSLGRPRTAAEEYVAQTSALKQFIPTEAERMIHDLQPFHRMAAFKDDPLWMVEQLNNIDKHRTLNLTVHGISSYRVDVLAGGKRFDACFKPAVHFEAGAELGRLPLNIGRPLTDREMQVNGDLIVEVAFKQVGARLNVPVIPLLTQLANYIWEILWAFAALPCWPFLTNPMRTFPPSWKP